MKFVLFARALPGKAERPETVNFDEPPAKLLARLYREKAQRGYRKTIDGVNLFARIDPGVAYQRCPGLRALLDDLLGRAKASGL
jgi:hypothetical protein